jgi:hypothetical protein
MMSLLRKQESRKIKIRMDSRLRGNDIGQDNYSDNRDNYRDR